MFSILKVWKDLLASTTHSVIQYSQHMISFSNGDYLNFDKLSMFEEKDEQAQ